jgi:hypothetical protein
VPLISNLKKASNFFLLSPVIVPATPQTIANRNKHWSQLEIWKDSKQTCLYMAARLTKHYHKRRAIFWTKRQKSKGWGD